MEIKEYQEYVRQGASDKYKDLKFAALALVGEVGEVCDAVKKRHIYTEQYTEKVNAELAYRAHIIEELGDVLWQWMACVNSLGIDVHDLIDANIEKLNMRHGGATLDKTGGKR